MAQEGNKIKFETNGIERATSNYNASNGGCNEIIGMIYRDGSLVPYESVDSNMPVYQETSQPVDSRFDKLWVHKTTKQNNYISLRQLNGYYDMRWKAESDMTSTAIGWTDINAALPLTTKKIDFVGNMIVVNGTVYLFENGAYTRGFDVSNIQFRMNLGAQGNGVAVMYDGVKFSYTDNTSLDANLTKLYQKTFGADNTYEQINADFKFLESEVKRGDYISGACFLRYAIKLYDGSYVGVSKPVLVMPDTYYKDLWGETYVANTHDTFSYDANPIKFAVKKTNEIPAPCPGLRLNPQLGLIQSLFGSTVFWTYVQMYDKGDYVSTIQQIVDIINTAIDGNGTITDTDSITYNIANLFIKRLNADGTTYDNFQPIDLDYWLLAKGKVGFREIFQFNNVSFDKKKYYQYNQSANIGSRLNYFDIVSSNNSIKSFERVKGWTWGAVPYFVPRLYETATSQNEIFDSSNMPMMIAAMLNPYKVGHDASQDTAATLRTWMQKSSTRDPFITSIETADGCDSNASWFMTRYFDYASRSSSNNLYVPYGELPTSHYRTLWTGCKGSIFAPLNEHIGELGFGAFNVMEFEGEGSNTQNNVAMVFGRECYTPVYEILSVDTLDKSLVQSIDIFMTVPVSIHEDYKTDSIRFDTMPAHRPYRKQQEVLDDLKKTLGQFHRIHSIPIEEIISESGSGSSRSVVAEHPLGKVMMPYIERGRIANIEQQPLLEWSGNNKNDYEVSYVYNNKLHIAQITDNFVEELYRDCNDELSLNNDARTQVLNEAYTLATQSQKSVADRITACSVHKNGFESNLLSALARSSQGISFSSVPEIRLVYLLEVLVDNVATTIVLKKRININREYPQNIGFFYPSSDAKKVELIGFETKQSVSGSPVRYFYEIPTVTFNLEQDVDNMIAYNLDLSSIYDYLTIANIGTYTAYTNESSFPYKQYEANNAYQRDLNIFKVSETNQPLVFPYANTYRVGYGKIIAFSSYSTALSQGQFGEYPLLVFTTESIFAMKVDTSGIGSYVSNAPLSREVCTNPNTIVQVDGGVFFGTAKGLMFISGNDAKKWSEVVNGEPVNTPNSSSTYTVGDGLVVYNLAVTSDSLVQLSGAISTEDFVDYLNLSDTHASFLYELNKLIIYNKNKGYSYLIDIDENGKCTKLGKTYYYDNGDYPNCMLSDGTTLRKFTLDGNQSADVDCLIQTRPILLDSEMPKSQYRVVLRGLFNTPVPQTGTYYSGIYILGSHDGQKWMFMGGSEIAHSTSYKLQDIGTTIERMSVKYLMAIYVSKNKCADTKVDNFEISLVEKYNDKTR